MKCWQGRGATGTAVGDASGAATWDDSLQFLRKLNIILPYNPAFVLLSIYPKELKTYVLTKTCPGMFTAALFIIVKTRKQRDILQVTDK